MRAGRFLVAPLSIALGLAGMGMATPADAAAQPGWGPVENVTESAPFTYGPDVGVDANGNAVAVWPRGEKRLRLIAAWRRAGGAWSAPRTVPGTLGAMEAEVVFDGSGELVLAWSAGRRVKAVRRPAGGSWGSPVTVHRTATGVRGTRPAQLDLAVNARGRAVLSWETMDDDLDATYARSRVQAAVGTPAGRWSRARTLSSARREAFDAEVAVSGRGRVTVVWDETARSLGQIMTASRAPGRGWDDTRALSRRLAHPSAPQLAGLPSGELAVAWGSGKSETAAIRLMRWKPGAGWRASGKVPGVRSDPWWLDLGMDGAGTVTLAWSNQAKSVWAASQTSAGAWSGGRIAPAGSVFYGLSVHVNLAGDTVVGWDAQHRRSHVEEAVYRSRAGTWGPVTELSDSRGDAAGLAVALADDGSATAAWLFGKRRGTSSRIQARTYEVL